ncbi:MAG: DUF5686 family protein [Bacteroidia bacterium]|nr:DUF5686 family protein [Bacteroidia bacterium]
MTKNLLLFFLLIFGGLSVFAQNLRGRVSDSEGSPIESVRVFADGSDFATLTRADGSFLLSLPKGSYRLVFQHLNFVTKVVPVEISGNQNLDITLEARDIQLETIEIHGGKRDPAYDIVRQIIDSKKDILSEVNSYTCETYQKIVLEVDTLLKGKEKKALIDSLGVDSLPKPGENRKPAELIESNSTIYFQAPATYKSVVHAYRNYSADKASRSVYDYDEGPATGYTSGLNDPYLFFQDVSEADFNFYRNLIDAPKLGDRPFVSPFNSVLWRVTYRYKLEKTWMENNRVHYQISFTPINRDGPYFSGKFEVEDDTWEIKSVDVEVLPSAMSYFRSFRILHTYSKTPDHQTYKSREEYVYEIKESKAVYFGRSLAIHTDYQANVDFPKNFFRNELRHTDKEAFEKDSATWANIRPMGLGLAEKSFIQKQDSIIAHRRSPEFRYKEDSAYNHLDFLDFLIYGVKWRDRERKMDYYFNPLIEQIQPLGVGGYRHQLGGSIGKRWTRYTAIRLGGEMNYGVVNKDLRGTANLSFIYAPKRFARGWIRAGNTYDFINNYETVFAFLSRSNFIQKKSIGIGHNFEVLNGLYLETSLDFADRSAIDQLELEQWSNQLFGDLNTPRTFDPYREFLIELKLTWTPGQKYQMEPFRKIVTGSRWPTFYAHYKKAVPGVFGSELNFDFLELGLNHEFKPSTLGTSRWSLSTGKFIQANNIRFTDYRFFRGSDPYFFANPMKNFQLLGPTISTKNEYLHAHFVHDFNGIWIDKIPLLKRTPLQESAGAATLLIRDGSFVHTELFVGLQWPFRVLKQRFRVGGFYVVSYSNNGNAISGQVKFGVNFFNPTKNQWEY